MTETTAPAESPSLFVELRRRRVPQIFGIYLGACWALLQFVDWLVKRYLFSPHITDLALVLLAFLIPSVLLLAYFHGKPGADRWTNVEKFGIPLNLAVAAAVLFLLFGDKNLGKLVQKVRIQNEEGQEVVRTVPKQNVIKKMAIFYFDPKGDLPELGWQGFTLPLLLELDLTQDGFMLVKSPFDVDPITTNFTMYEEILEAGFGDGVGMPLALQANIAKKTHVPVFLTGSLEKRAEGFVATYKFYETDNSKLKASGEIANPTYLGLVDQLSVAIRKAVGVPKVHLEETSDLPVKELLTKSPEALKRFALGYKKLKGGDLGGAIASFESAVETDPTFAQAYQYLQYSYLLNNQNEKREALFKPMMKHLYKFPEREKYYIKAGYYVAKQDVDKAVAVLKMVTKLFPQDITGWSMLALFQSLGNDFSNAIANYERVLELDSYSYDVLLTIGNLYLRQGKYGDAATQYQRYVDQFPDQIQGYQALGELYIRKGEYEKASANFEKALLLEPENVATLLKTSEVAAKAGKYARTEEILETALDVADRPEDKYQVYQRMERFYLLKGELKRAFENMKLKDLAFAQFQRPFMVSMAKLDSMGLYAHMGKVEEAKRILAGIKESLSPPMDSFVCVGEIGLYFTTEDEEALQTAVKDLEALIQSSKNELLRPMFHIGQGRTFEIRGDFPNALKEYGEGLKLSPDNPKLLRDMGVCLREMGKLDEAESRLEQSLKLSPFHPKTHFEMAILKQKKGESQSADKHLEQALEVWKDADPEYDPAKKARAKKEAWRKLS